MDRRWPDSAPAHARWASTTVLAATLVFVIDRISIAIYARGSVRWRWIHELTLWGGYVSLELLVAAIAFAGWLLAQRLPRGLRGRGMRDRAMPGVAAALFVVAPAWQIGSTLAAGPWISEQWFSPLVVAAPIVAVLLGGPLASLSLLTRIEPDRWRFLHHAVLVAGLSALSNADHRISPGLYPGFHLLLELLIAVTAGLVVWHVVPELRLLTQPRTLRLAAPLSLAFCTAGAALWFGMSNSTRGGLILRSSVARVWIREAMPNRPSTLLRDTLAGMGESPAHDRIANPPLDTTAFVRNPRWNIVLVVADTMRADTVPPARPSEGLPFAQPGDTPRIDAWMESSVRFEFAYSAATETKRAMPAMFRSIESSDDPMTNGIPIGDRMERLGLTPVSVVHGYFMPAKYPPVAALLDGFTDIRVYENHTTDTAVPMALEMISSVRDRQFLLFLHLYTLHLPGFDGEIIDRDDGTRPEKYQRALRYLDGQFGAMLDGLDELGVSDRTIVVLVGDHGEGLGEHGQLLHGPNVFDEDVRVPLAIAIPGHAGRVVRETVGTIDLVPTLVDLLGAESDVEDRGRTLVPLLDGATAQPDRPYYFENSDATTVGVVIGRDKLIYENRADLAYRFDLSADPDEYEDLHDVSDVHETLTRTLVQFKPEITAEELEDPATVQLLRERLAQIDPNDPGEDMRLLVRLVALVPDADLLARCADIFNSSTNRETRLLLVRYLLSTSPETWSQIVVDWIRSEEGTPEELEIVSALAFQGQPEFAAETISELMNVHARFGGMETWEPWLRLIRSWNKSADVFSEPLARMLGRTRAEGSLSSSLSELLLENVAELEGSPDSKARLLAGATRFLASDEPRVRAAAVRVLGALGDSKVKKRVVEKLMDKNEDVRVRREAASALTTLLGDKALPSLSKVAGEPGMTTLVVRHLRDHGSPEAIKILEKIKKDGANSDIRSEARKAIDAITYRAEELAAGTSEG